MLHCRLSSACQVAGLSRYLSLVVWEMYLHKRLSLIAVLEALGFIGLFGAALMLASAYAEASFLPKPGRDGFIVLFNGRDLAGWAGLRQYWSVSEGAIRGHETRDSSKQTFLVFAGLEVKDFELHARYRFPSPTGNSGIQFRSKMIDPQTFRVGGYQADFDAEAKFDGSIYDEAGIAGNRGTMSNRGERTVWDAEGKRHNTPINGSGVELSQAIEGGAWNDIVLVAKGPHITYSINGHLMTDLIDNSPAALQRGLLALQLHEGYTMDVDIADLRLKVL
jgi:hypothetical protein